MIVLKYLGFIVSVTLLVIISSEFLVFATSPSLEHCLPGWRNFTQRGRKRCLAVFENSATNWWNAEEECRKMHGHLVSVKNKTELEIVNRTLYQLAQYQWETTINSPHYLWIGLGQMCPDGDLSWSDGTQDNKTFRPIQNAKDKKNNSCVALKYSALRNGSENSWFYRNCSEKLHYMCSAKPIFTDYSRYIENEKKKEEESDIDMEDPGPCGNPDWCYYKNPSSKLEACYWINEKWMIFDRALDMCRAEDPDVDLVSIHSADQVQFINKMVKLHPAFQNYEVWLGLNKLNPDRAYEWTDGSPLDHLTSVQSVDPKLSELHQGSCVSMTVAPRQRHYPLPFVRLAYTKTDDSSSSVGEWRKRRCADVTLPSVCMKTLSSSYQPKQTTAEPKKKQAYCKQGWIRYRDFCYKYMGEKKNVKEAQDDCASSGSSTLVSIGDSFVQGFVVSLLKMYGTDVWIGLNVTNGKAMWTDDRTPFYYSHFNLNTKVMRFVATSLLHKNATKVKESDLWTCESLKLAYICQAQRTEEKETISQEDQNCRKIYEGLSSSVYAYNGSCYAFPENQSSSWEEAEKTCRNISKNSSLVSLEDIFEWGYVYSRAEETFNRSDFWIGLKNEQNSFSWSRNGSGSPKISPWGINEPSIRPDMSCVSASLPSIYHRGSHWKMERCERRLPFVCKASNESVVTENETKVEGDCGNRTKNWVKAGSQCYVIVVDSTATGYQASHHCFVKYGANLASFESKETFQTITVHMISKAERSFSNEYYIGLVEHIGGGYAWKDKTALSFTNWGPDEGIGRHGGRQGMCVAVDASNRWQWYEISCTRSHHYVCSKPITPKPTASTTTAKPTPSAKTSKTTPTTKSIITSSTKKPTPQTGSAEKAVTSKSKTESKTDTKIRVDVKTPDDKGETAHSTGTKDKKSASGMSGGLIVAIIAVVLFVVIIMAFFGVMFMKKRRIFFRPGEPGIMHFDILQQEEDGY